MFCHFNYRYLPSLLVATLLLPGCVSSSGPDEKQVAPPTVREADAFGVTGESTSLEKKNPAPLLPSALFPGEAKEFVAWRCTPAQDLVSAATPRKLRLWSGQGAYRLEPAVVASGARYVKADLSFWNKGKEATVESDKGRLRCEQDETRKVLTRRQRPDVMFHGRGNEPGWTVRLASDRPRLALMLDYGEREIDAAYRVTSLDNDAGRVTLESARKDLPFTLSLEGRACFDAMSGEPYPARVTLRLDGKTYRGCGQGIAP
ncbi:C-type lysozyme, inhibitor [Pistricoccus aurantiacus]|uniref:C-type lysozyme, inhibitor n=1 Tax=Pistricoccus aurantiacus TaxID=1883414 RepID=A0A5B8SL50_9GAMM|nr:C-type lysozyme, inhibitor [Pistricoccus aurantiacus]